MTVFASTSVSSCGRWLVAFVAAAAALACLPAQAQKPAKAPDAHTAANSLDWPGTYAGTLPSGSGTGYRTVLVLREGKTYTLMQDIEHKGKPYAESTKGRFTWEKGTHIRLGRESDRQRFLVSEGFVELQNDAPPPADMAKEYQLVKLQSFAVKDEELLVYPASVVQGKPKAGWVSFEGLWNMHHATQAGHKSLKASFALHCKANEYRMPTMQYYAGLYGRGELIDSTKNNDNDISINAQDRLMTQVVQAYCRG